MADLTFLFTDVVGSTQRWEADADAMATALADHDAAIAAAVAAHGGTLLKTKGEGDSTVSVFSQPSDALAAAAAAQRSVTMPVRMAVHTGPAEGRDGDYFGPTLNRTARLRAIAHGGQIICSEAAGMAAGGLLADGLGLISVGVHRLKDLAAPEHVFQLTGDGLVAEFPPLTSLNRSATNLPAQQSSFVGRLSELAHVRSLVAATRLVTLVGAGGTGKTRLAIEAAAECFDDFPDGVWFCELAPISDDAAVANVVAAAANITLLPGDASAQVVGALAERTALVVLDNCEHVVEGAAALVAALLAGAPHVRVIATSRERLRIAGESAWTVPTLGLPLDDTAATTSEAVQLFLERAAVAAPGLSVDEGVLADALAICRRVEGAPLAIELAAARVRMMPVHDLRARLEHHWDILSGGDRDALPHQRSLRATIDWSHSLLTPPVQEVLHRLAAFRGGFELSSAERVLVACGINEYVALDAVQDLLDKSLVGVDHETGRYRILETVREYALEQLEAADLVDATRRAHAAHFVEVLRDVEDRLLQAKDQRNALLLVADEHDNIVAALTWSLEHDHVIAGQLVGYTFAAWYGLGQPETATWYRRLVPFIDELGGETAMRACLAVGTILGYLGDGEVAFPLLDRSIAEARGLGDPENLALALSLTASVHRVYEELDVSLPMTREAMTIPIKSERIVIRILVCSWGSWVLADTGFKQEARDAIVEGYELCQECGDHLVLSSILDSIGHAAPDYMSAEDAFAALQEEREWLHRAGASETAAAMVTVGWAFMREKRWADALDEIDRLLAMPQTHWRQVFFWKLTRAALLQLLDRPHEALALNEAMLAEARTPVDRHHALCDLAVARRGVGDLDGAEAALDEALQYVLDGHNPAGGWGVAPTEVLIGWLLMLRATLLVARGDADKNVIARLVGASRGVSGRDAFDISFETTRIVWGYEDALSEADAAAEAFAATAPLAEVVAFALAE